MKVAGTSWKILYENATIESSLQEKGIIIASYHRFYMKNEETLWHLLWKCSFVRFGHG